MYGDIDGLLGDPGEPGWLGDQPGDKPDASDAPDGEKLGPPGVIPLADGWEKIMSIHNWLCCMKIIMI